MNKTHGQMIVGELRRRALTYAGMFAASPSLSPQKRVMECLALHPELELVKGVKACGHAELVTWSVKKVKKST